MINKVILIILVVFLAIIIFKMYLLGLAVYYNTIYGMGSRSIRYDNDEYEILLDAIWKLKQADPHRNDNRANKVALMNVHISPCLLRGEEGKRGTLAVLSRLTQINPIIFVSPRLLHDDFGTNVLFAGILLHEWVHTTQLIPAQGEYEAHDMEFDFYYRLYQYYLHKDDRDLAKTVRDVAESREMETNELYRFKGIYHFLVEND